MVTEAHNGVLNMKILFLLMLATGVSLLRLEAAIGAEPISAEKLAEFYPASFEADAISEPGLSHLEIPGWQLSSTTRMYKFGSVEITYYATDDHVFQKKLDKLRPDRYASESMERQGFPTILVTKITNGEPVKILADLGGEIVLIIDCYTCKTRDEYFETLAAFDLQGLAMLLE